MTSKYQKAKGRSGPTFVMLRHDIMDSLAWKSLSPNAQALWLHVRKRYNGSNNGNIALSCREAGELLNVSKNTPVAAFRELMEKGFLAVGADSKFNMKTKKSRRWIMTDESFNGRPPTNEWRSWKPEKN